ncbi:MAG TPA: hypothetical protein VJS47_01550 [Rhizomicrobium sp.]|nr:hypothetical protein [Rhizomicrobium sp.]
MKLALTYRGELRANGGPKPKWEIRKQFAPQLAEFWRLSPSMKMLEAMRYLPTEGFKLTAERHHSFSPNKDPLPPTMYDHIDLCAPVARGSKTFLPIVRDSLALQCGLKILFMRQEEPGRIYQGGDMDNRLKTLLDALSVPTLEQVVEDDQPSPVHCLLEDDRLVTRLDVDTQRLLSAPGASCHEVNLVIEVDIRVTQPRTYNHIFLGD